MDETHAALRIDGITVRFGGITALDELKKMRDSMQQTASSFESSVQSEVQKTESEVKAAVEDKPAQSKPAEAKP